MKIDKLHIILIIIIIGGFIYFKNKTSDLEYKLRENDIKHKKELQAVRDSTHLEIEKITTNYKTKFDSIANAPYKIKYIRYEKPVYIDRTFDDAINIITSYRYNAKSD